MGWLYPATGYRIDFIENRRRLGRRFAFSGSLRGDLDVNEPWTCTGHGIVNLIEVLAEFNAILIKD